jgi:hypothetical protein
MAKKVNDDFDEDFDDNLDEMTETSSEDDIDDTDDEDTDDLDASKPFKSTGLGIAGKYASMASTFGQKKTYNLKQIEDVVNTFIRQFNKPSEQRTVVRLLRKKLLHAKDMFKAESESI